MFSLNARVDGFRFQFPKEFLTDNIKQKYSVILQKKNNFILDPLEFLNETIKNVNILGFSDASLQQKQQFREYEESTTRRISVHTLNNVSYRSEMNPISLFSDILEINFRHTLGFVNYFMLLENFFETYSRSYDKNKLPEIFSIQMFDNKGVTRSRLKLFTPILDGMDGLEFDYTQPVATNKEFKVQFKFSNLDYEFFSDENDEGNLLSDIYGNDYEKE